MSKKAKHPDGIEIYKGRKGRGKGKFRARLWVNGQIVAINGEGYVRHDLAESWGMRTYRALRKALHVGG